MSIDQNLIAKCKKAGKLDFQDDLGQVPHASARLNEITAHLTAVGEAIPYIKAWLSAHRVRQAVV